MCVGVCVGVCVCVCVCARASVHGKLTFDQCRQDVTFTLHRQLMNSYYRNDYNKLIMVTSVKLSGRIQNLQTSGGE